MKGLSLITHCALFTFNEGTKDEEIEDLMSALETLKDDIPEIQSFRAGKGSDLASTTCDFAVVAEFADLDAYKIYATHAAHIKVIENKLKPILATRTAIQFES